MDELSIQPDQGKDTQQSVDDAAKSANKGEEIATRSDAEATKAAAEGVDRDVPKERDDDFDRDFDR